MRRTSKYMVRTDWTGAPLSRGARAFSLIEVVIALGIVASVLVALIGLFAYGAGSMREATDTAVEARIVHDIAQDVQALDWQEHGWDNPSKSETLTYRYDNQGEKIARNEEPLYVAEAEVLSAAGSPVNLPGVSMTKTTQLAKAYIRKVRIRVGRFPAGVSGNSVTWDEQSEGKTWNEYTTIVVNLEEEGEGQTASSAP